ncbi:MAG: hypothetical protein PHO02_02535 [Candidatus Nanoarchaeia archaeon]|nr:hypothetical protein [Candidatus Nanoarchaeia archaeon]
MKIICRTPVRINLANGGDTDYYLKEIGWGCVVNATLASHFYEFAINDDDKATLDVVDYFDYIANPNRTYRLESNVSELDLLKTTMKELNVDIKNSFALRTNVPMQSGLGGSSALNIAMISALLHQKGEEIIPHKIAALSYDIERKKMNVPGGYQDQYASAYGSGFNYMEFRDNGATVSNMGLNEDVLEKLEKNLLLFYIAKRKFSGSKMHDLQKESAEKDPEKVKQLLLEKRENALAIKGALLSGNLDEFGKLLLKEGQIKTRLSGSGNEFFEGIMALALENGALGGKISGAGSGGCMFFYVPDEKIEGFRNAIASTGAVEMNYRFQRSYEHGIFLKTL